MMSKFPQSTYHPMSIHVHPMSKSSHFHLSEVWDDWVQAVDQGNAAAEWLSTVLQVPKLRLVPWIAPLLSPVCIPKVQV